MKELNNGKFIFIGGLQTGKEPVTEQALGDKGWKKTRMSMGVKADQNMQFLNMEYMHHPKFDTFKLVGAGDFKMFDVKASETTNPDIIKKAAEFTHITVDLEDDFTKKDEYMKLFFKKRNHEMKKDDEKTDDDIEKIKEYEAQINEIADKRVTFCHMKDVIEYINGKLPEIKDKKIKVTGNIKCNYYNGKNSLQYVPTLIEIVPNDTQPMLRAYVDVFFEKDSLDDSKKEKKFFVNGYLGENIKNKETKVKELKLFPTMIVIDYTKLDLENTQHQGLLEFLKKTFEIKNKKQVHRIGVEIAVVNGREQVEFDESQLTDFQRQQILFGQATLDEFRPRGNSYGEKMQELKVIRADLKKFPEGAIEVFPVKELVEHLATNDGDVTKDKLKDEEPKKEEKKEEDSKTDMMAALFS